MNIKNKITNILDGLRTTDVAVLVILYSVTFVGLLFANIEDIAFMKVDPGSITNSIYSLFKPPYYDMLDSYHSRYYGWTYFFINFIALLPLKLLYTLENYQLTNFFVRLILFVIGMAAVLVFRELTLRVTKNKNIALAASVFFIFSPPLSHFWYTIHPESTGILFFLLGTMVFLKYMEEKTSYLYYLCITMLALSSLAKQPFFILSLALIACIYFDYCRSKFSGIGDCVKSSEFWKMILKTTILSFFILLIIHPYAIINAPEFFKYQFKIVEKHSTETALTDALYGWVIVLIYNPLIVAHVLLMIFAIIARTLKYNISNLFLYSVIASNTVMLIFMSMERYFFYDTYMAPLFPIFILNISVALVYLFRKIEPSKYSTMVKSAISIALLYPVLLAITSTVGSSLEIGLLHKNTTKRLSWDYIQQLPSDTRIVFDPTVAMPPQFVKQSCHIWRGCGREDYLKKYNPDYFIIFADYKYMNKEVIFGYMDEHNFCAIERLEGTMPIKSSNLTGEKAHGYYDIGKNVKRIKSLFDTWKSNNIVGNTVTVYKRC